MLKKAINLLTFLSLGFSYQLLSLANTENIEPPILEVSKESKIHSLPLNPTFRFSVEEMSEGEKDLLNVLLPMPEQDPKEVSKLVKSTRDPFIEQSNNQSNYAINIINKIKLAGVFESNNEVFAIITNKDGKELSFKNGQIIEQGIKITAISIKKQFIELTHEKERYRIRMKI